jgi:hypothetical protein
MPPRRPPDLDRLLELADALAGTWAARGAASTTVGRERAILRLLGVQGLDRSGVPLAGEVVDRYVGRSSARLAGGVALPFAMAVVEYDLSPQEVALDVASGKIDLRLEADLLADADRRAAAERTAADLAAAAIERIDANRTARAELMSVLGDVPPPWIGASTTETDLEPARQEVGRLVGAGADCVRVATPVGRELADRLYDAGVTVDAWRPRLLGSEGVPAEPTPAGSQRGLAELREVVDRGAAERGSYVRLATSAPPLAAPEQAVVAAFERLDIVAVDLLAEVVEASVDPDRALADHAFAKALHRRAGTLVVIGPGPLVVAPDMRRGVPSTPATRAGRALALQALSVALARRHGLPAEQIAVGALPAWLADEPDAVAQAFAQVSLRRALFPDLRLAFEEATASRRDAAGWSVLLGSVLQIAGAVALLDRGSAAADIEGAAGADVAGADVAGVGAAGAAALVNWTRAAARVGREAAAALEPGALRGAARALVDESLAGAVETLRRLSDDGWEAILGEPIGGADRPRLGADAVVERTESFDPFAPGRPSRTFPD